MSTEDVKKSGYLKKLKHIPIDNMSMCLYCLYGWRYQAYRSWRKTLKKKFFVLRDESAAGPARLEYYDSEKKWNSGTAPKKSIIIKTCFNINRKLDAKHKWVIALYTKNDCFTIAFEGENELDAWLTILLELQHGNEWLANHERPKPNFEHVWEVSVKCRSMPIERKIFGLFRLCLTQRTLSLVGIGSIEPSVYEFPMMMVRRCGHSDSYFYMEVGRSSVLGPGEIWMLTEDALIARNMHETILIAMKSTDTDTSALPRHRSQSATESAKPISTPGRRQTVNIISSHAHTARERCDSMPSRPRTISDGHREATRHDQSLINCDSRSSAYNRTMSCSPPYSSESLGFDISGSGAEDGSRSSLSASDSNVSHPEMLHLKDSPLEPAIEEEGSQYTLMSLDETNQLGYMEMQPCRNRNHSPTSPQFGRSSLVTPDRSSVISPQNLLPGSIPTSASLSEDYLDMSPAVITTSTVTVSPVADGYVPMSPIGSLLSKEVKENVNGGLTKVDQETPEGYVPMTPLVESLNQTLKSYSPPDEGYMDMAPLSRTISRGNNQAETSVELSSRRSSDSPSTDLCFAEYPLDKVQAYFTPSEDDEPMIRACSIGSRADCKAKNNRLEVATDYRTRAFSVGSNVKRNACLGSKLNHGVIRGKGAVGKLHPLIGDSNVGVEMANGNGSKKSTSAPVLGTSPLVNSVWQANMTSVGKKQNKNEDLMEMDFPESQNTSDHRKSSSSVSGRPRANSKSSHIRHPAKTELSPYLAIGQKKVAQEQTSKTPDYLFMEASSRNLSLQNDASTGDRKCSLPITITEASLVKDNRRSSDISLTSENFGEYVNIDPSRSVEYRASPSSTSSPLLTGLLGASLLSHRPASEYVNLQYGYQPTRDSILEEKIDVTKLKTNSLSAATANETDSDYTLMAPGYPTMKVEHEPLSPTLQNNDMSTSSPTKSSVLKSSPFASIPDGETQEPDDVERQLNYAALDLPSSSNTSFDDSEGKNKTVSPTLSHGSSTTALNEETPTTASMYAKIDFVKSESLRSQTQNTSN